jgi:tRNA threonylcarbamoyladenosine biosynthesis protein TsaE
MTTIDVVSHSLAQTQRLGAKLAALLGPGDVLLLRGALGAGKTSFTQGIAQGLGVTDVVNSPTFVLARQYAGRLDLYHMDYYRLDRPAEPGELGFDEYFYGDGVTVVEWPERAAGLPAEHIGVAFKLVSETKRSVLFEPHGARYERLLAEFRRLAFGMP